MIQETKTEAVMLFVILPQKVTQHNIHCVLLVAPATSDSMWEGTNYAREYGLSRRASLGNITEAD